MEERNGLIQWIKKHRKELEAAGIGAIALISIILGFKNRETIKEALYPLGNVMRHSSKTVSETTVKLAVELQSEPFQEVIAAVTARSESLPFEVSGHIRNLMGNRQASPAKIAEALQKNITLAEHQTWVDSYMKGGSAA